MVHGKPSRRNPDTASSVVAQSQRIIPALHQPRIGSSRANTSRQPSPVVSATTQISSTGTVLFPSLWHTNSAVKAHSSAYNLGPTNEHHLHAPPELISLPLMPSSSARLYRACVSFDHNSMVLRVAYWTGRSSWQAMPNRWHFTQKPEH